MCLQGRCNGKAAIYPLSSFEEAAWVNATPNLKWVSSGTATSGTCAKTTAWLKAIHRTLHLKWQTGYRIQAQHTADRTGKVCIRATKRARVQSRILGGL